MTNFQFIKNKQTKTSSGFSLPEMIVVSAIFILIVIAVSAFSRNTFFLSDVIQSGLTTQYEARKIIRPMADEIRSAVVSANGAFPIKEASTTLFAFYVDIDDDGRAEEVRYYLEGTIFKKGTIEASGGEPFVYDPADETVIEIVHDVRNGTSTPVFEYFDSGYNGTSSTTPLSIPVSPSDVRLVKATLIVDSDPSRPPSEVTLTTQASLRNVKDNL